MTAVAELGQIPAGYAYLDLAEPDLHTAAATLAAAGHRRAVVVPLLFTVAFHATIDVPQAVQAAAESSGVELTVADILGTGNDIAELLSTSLTDAGIATGSSVLLYAVGSSNPAANAAVVDLAARLHLRLSGVEGGRPPSGNTAHHLPVGQGGRPPVRAAFATCSPGPTEVLDELPDPVAVLPLFLADGLLLDPVRALAAERGWTMVEPLGERAAGIVLDRYQAALHEPADTSPTDRFDQ
jgi:sirohydrochlorin cobaltochelatase